MTSVLTIPLVSSEFSEHVLESMLTLCVRTALILGVVPPFDSPVLLQNTIAWFVRHRAQFLRLTTSTSVHSQSWYIYPLLVRTLVHPHAIADTANENMRAMAYLREVLHTSAGSSHLKLKASSARLFLWTRHFALLPCLSKEEEIVCGDIYSEYAHVQYRLAACMMHMAGVAEATENMHANMLTQASVCLDMAASALCEIAWHARDKMEVCIDKFSVLSSSMNLVDMRRAIVLFMHHLHTNAVEGDNILTPHHQSDAPTQGARAALASQAQVQSRLNNRRNYTAKLANICTTVCDMQRACDSMFTHLGCEGHAADIIESRKLRIMHIFSALEAYCHGLTLLYTHDLVYSPPLQVSRTNADQQAGIFDVVAAIEAYVLESENKTVVKFTPTEVSRIVSTYDLLVPKIPHAVAVEIASLFAAASAHISSCPADSNFMNTMNRFGCETLAKFIHRVVNTLPRILATYIKFLHLVDKNIAEEGVNSPQKMHAAVLAPVMPFVAAVQLVANVDAETCVSTAAAGISSALVPHAQIAAAVASDRPEDVLFGQGADNYLEVLAREIGTENVERVVVVDTVKDFYKQNKFIEYMHAKLLEDCRNSILK